MMSDANKAVFLSYASQDAGAARKICDVLHAAGVEVWFDQSELVGGDAWDGRGTRRVLGLEFGVRSWKLRKLMTCLVTEPNPPELLRWKAQLLALAGQSEAAEKT